MSATALALFWLAPTFYLLLLGRLFQGAAAAATWTAGLALIAEHFPAKRVEMIGYALMGSTAGSLLGPIIGGSLYEVGGYALPFAATGVLVAIDAGMRVFLLPRDMGSRRAKPRYPGSPARQIGPDGSRGGGLGRDRLGHHRAAVAGTVGSLRGNPRGNWH